MLRQRKDNIAEKDKLRVKIRSTLNPNIGYLKAMRVGASLLTLLTHIL